MLRARRGQAGPPRRAIAITHQGRGRVAPCWELFVQLADYAWLRTVSERHGQEVRLEDRLMDLTVRAGRRLVLYVEQKTSRSVASKLLARMREYGEKGFDLDDPDRGDDALRKAKYLVRSGAHPIYFGLSAVDYAQLFKVDYLDGNRFRLSEDSRSFSAPLAEEAGCTTAATAEPPGGRSTRRLRTSRPRVDRRSRP